jgi:hypothetical protein
MDRRGNSPRGNQFGRGGGAVGRGSGGRPQVRPQFTERQETSQQARAAKVDEVCIFMASKGFRSPAEFLKEFFGNPKCNARQSGIYKRGGGFEDILELMLQDHRGGLSDPAPQPLIRWLYTRVESEVDGLINNKKLDTKLRYSKSQKDMPNLSLFRAIIEEHCPLLWGLANRIATKEHLRSEEEFMASMSADSDEQGHSRLITLSAIMALIYARNQKVNSFQVLFGVFYYAHGLEKRAREILMKQGLMVSPSTSEAVMREMAAVVRQGLQTRSRRIPQVISIDNVNQKIGVRHTNLQAKSHIDNSTAGFAMDMLGYENLLPAGAIGIPMEWWKRGDRKNMTSLDMLPKKESVQYINEQTPALLTDVLMKHITGFRPNRKEYFPHKNVQRLSTKDSQNRLSSAFELMTYDQSTIDGNGDSLRHASSVECGYTKEELENILILVSGDQLTLDRIRSLQFLKKSDTWGNRFNWAFPLMGLFHLSLNYIKMFMKNHVGDPSDISTVAGCNTLLRREKISEQVPDFWSAIELIDDSLDAYVLALVMEESNVENIDNLQRFLEADAKLDNPTWPEIVKRCSELMKMNAVWKLRQGQERDQKRENALLFMRNALSFRDFWLAGKYGDIGRCINRMDSWAFQFIGAGQHRYAHELMEIKCGFH